ncbi:sodium/bile acid cotransporter [Eurytemora carolleeae]|uniref:sodium/bile acid cotransporter n=1 Tax=Eurytemora carolleeae TaxID=1294199 RepID=UPI000C790D7E|nr:sodium/bile acid cotransporter [Eurytemora carolleeae]|eukprot:XP_023320699.1 sodium/bile acid cotransporter-like [Eurytemora affinis]
MKYLVIIFLTVFIVPRTISGLKEDEKVGEDQQNDQMAEKVSEINPDEFLEILDLEPGLRVYPRVLKGSVSEEMNFTILSNYSRYRQVCWESNGPYVLSEMKCLNLELDVNNITVHLSSDLLGIYYIRFYTEERGVKVYLDSPDIELVVKRQSEKMNTLVTLLFTVVLGLALTLMGLDIDIQIVLQTLKRPIGPAVGMLSQFLVMPIGSYLIGWALLSTNYERLGLLLLGCSPGGAASNFWAAMFGGDVNLSVTMTFLSSVASFAFTSLWIYVLGTPLVSKTIPIPYLRLVISLVSFTFPILIGVAFKHYFPRAGKMLKEKISRPFFFTCLLILPAVGTWNNLFFFYLATWQHLISGTLLGLVGYAFGAGLAFLFKMDKPQIIAISLETAIQNGGIAFIVLSLTFPSPYSDMGIMPILGFFFCSTGPIMFVVYLFYMIFQKIMKKRKFSQVAVEEEKELERL